MPLLAGECLGPSPGVEEVTGRAAVMRGMWLLLSKCLEASWVLHHSTDPFPVALLPLGPAWPAAPGGSVTSHHFHCLPLAAVPPLIIFGCPRSVRPGLAAPPAPTEHRVSSPSAVVGAALLSPQPDPVPKGLEAAGGHPVFMPGLLSPTASPCSAIAH